MPLKARLLLPQLLAVARGELGMPLAELIVLLIIAFQLHGHCPNDGFAFTCAHKLLQIMRRLRDEDSTALKSDLHLGSNLPMSSLSFSVYRICIVD